MGCESFKCMGIQNSSCMYTLKSTETGKIKVMSLPKLLDLINRGEVKVLDASGRRLDVVEHRKNYEKVRSAATVQVHKLLKELSIVVPQMLDNLTYGEHKIGKTYYSLMAEEDLQDQTEILVKAIIDKKKTCGILSDSVSVSDGIAVRNTIVFEADGNKIKFTEADSISLNNKYAEMEFKEIGKSHSDTMLINDFKTTLFDQQLYVRTNTRIKDLGIKGAAENLRILRLTNLDYRYLKYQFILSDCIAKCSKPLVITSNKQSIMFNEIAVDGTKTKKFTLSQLLEAVHKKMKSKVTRADIAAYIGG